MVDKDDWRLRGQDEVMKLLKFQYKKYVAQDEGLHTHCEFCWHKFMERPEGMEDCSDAGYCSLDGRYWVCEECFHDFKDMFEWELVN